MNYFTLSINIYFFFGTNTICPDFRTYGALSLFVFTNFFQLIPNLFDMSSIVSSLETVYSSHPFPLYFFLVIALLSVTTTRANKRNPPITMVSLRSEIPVTVGISTCSCRKRCSFERFRY